MAKNDNKVTGNKGEEIASKYLENKGYRIEERNFRTRFGEIDIVCWDKDILVFVEVKTKIGHDFGEPEDMVNKSKLKQVERMGEIFIEMKNNHNKMICINSGSRSEITKDNKYVWSGLCRVDVVSVVLFPDGKIEMVKHYEAVY